MRGESDGRGCSSSTTLQNQDRSPSSLLLQASPVFPSSSSPPSQAYWYIFHITCPLTTHIPSLVVTSRHVTSSSTAQRQVLNPVTYQVFSPLAIPIFALWNGGSALFFIRLLFPSRKRLCRRTAENYWNAPSCVSPAGPRTRYVSVPRKVGANCK